MYFQLTTLVETYTELNLMLIISFFTIIAQSHAFIDHTSLSTKRCWFIHGDNSELMNVIIGIYYKLPYKGRNEDNRLFVSWTDANFIAQNNTPNCDGFMVIYSNINDPGLENYIETVNKTAIVDTKFLLITENLNQDYEDIDELFKTTYLNSLVIRINKNIINNNIYNEILFDIDSFVVRSPFMNVTVEFDNEDKLFKGAQTNYSSLDEIFKLQEWNPSNNNVTLRILANMYAPFSTINEKGEVSGFEYKVVKGSADKWKSSVKSLDEAGVKVKS